MEYYFRNFKSYDHSKNVRIFIERPGDFEFIDCYYHLN